MLYHKVGLIAALFFLPFAGKLQAQVTGTIQESANSKLVSAEKIAARKEKYLKGLTKISSEKELKLADSITNLKGGSQSDIIYLTQDYRRSDYYSFSSLIEYSDYKWAADVYVNSDFVIFAKVIRPATKADKDKALKELKALIDVKTPQSIEREKIIAGQLNKPAPLFSVLDVDSVKYELSALKGKVVVLNFWFIGCGPCKKEMPELNKMVKKYKSKDVVFLAFEVNDNTPNKIKAVTEGNFDYIHVPAKRADIAVKYQIKTYPTSYVIDQSGIIRFGLAAYDPFKLPEMDKTIESLLK